jgi:hypothetical protein
MIETIMNIEECARTYSDFFSRYNITTRITVDDEPLHMHQVQAVGHVDDLGKLIEKCSTMSTDELLFESDKYFNNSFVGESFFYFAMRGLLREQEMREIADEFMKRSKIADNPYTIHQLHGSSVQDHSQSIFIFLDWDGTLEVFDREEKTYSLRENVPEFLHHYKQMNRDLGVNKYRFIITSASPNIIDKVRTYPDILEQVDGISSVTGITRLIKERNKNQVFGKLYTDICKRLGIHFSRAIAITDYWFDRSVENTFPINTIVTAPDIPADSWIKIFDTFERKGDGNLYMGFTELRRSPYEFRDIPVPHTKKIDSVRSYKIGNEISLYRTTLLGDCFFIYPGKIPPETPESMLKNLNSVYRTIFKKF